MKKMNRRITLLAVFLCTMVAGVYAQSDDFGIWTSAEVKKKIFPALMLRWKVNSVLVMVWIMLNAGLQGRVWLIASLLF